MKKLRVGLVGIGNMGRSHLMYLRRMEDGGRLTLEAVCDTALDRYSANLGEFGYTGVRTYSDFDNFLRQERGLDFIVLCTPLMLHRDMLITAVKAGHNVMLEKPPAVTIQDIDEMIKTAKESGMRVAVGFQMTAAKSFIAFCDRIRAGNIGRVQKVTAVGIWSRPRSYYDRTSWAGKLRIGGKYVLDGTVNNPFAHTLNNSLIVAGLSGDSTPDTVTAELYHANDIESEDTSCLRIVTRGGVEVFFTATVASVTQSDPYIEAEGTEGWARWDYNGSIRFSRVRGGEPFCSENIRTEAHKDLYENICDYFSGVTASPSCTLAETRSFVLASDLAFESSQLTHAIPAQYLKKTGEGEDEVTSIPGICELMEKAASEHRLFSELGTPWGVKTKPFRNEGYSRFAL